MIATITDPAVIRTILDHLDLPTEAPTPTPTQVTGWLPGVEPPADWINE